MKTYDVTALGELLIDFTENGISGQGNPVLEANPGGAPCNVLSMLSKLGHKGAFIGKIGDDMFGNQLTYAIKEVGIDTTGLKRDSQVHTTLAFVHTLEDGDREFSFYRNPGADMMLSKSDIDETLIKDSKIFHFGSLSMTDEVCRKATRKVSYSIDSVIYGQEWQQSLYRQVPSGTTGICDRRYHRDDWGRRCILRLYPALHTGTWMA